VFTVHEGIDVERVAHTPLVSVHEALWLPSQAPVVGNMGALVEHKGQRHLIDAAAAVVRQVPDTRFVILGEGPLRAVLEHQVKALHLEKHVFLPGFRVDAIGLLKSFDIFVMCSEMEGLGTSTLDAMAAGKPAIGTRIGGIPEVVEDGRTGLLVPPADPDRLADAIVELLRDPAKRQRMGEAGWIRVREHFTVERMIDGTRKVYREVLATRGRLGGNLDVQVGPAKAGRHD
jgi:glycosyltransferase involved in cell wall biosynthesis